MNKAVNVRVLSLSNWLHKRSVSFSAGITCGERSSLAKLSAPNVLNLNKENLNTLRNVPVVVLDCLKAMPFCELELLVQEYRKGTDNNESSIWVQQSRDEP